MAAISVRDLDDEVAARLKGQAARHGGSMEAEVRAILTASLTGGELERPNLGQAIRERFAELGWAELDIPARRDMPHAADLPESS